MTKKRVILTAVAMSTAAIFGIAALQRLLMPKYMSDVVEGNLIADYYNSSYDHDVLFIGDCEVYENISPVKLWEDYGISSYIRGSAQQLIWQSYYLLEDALRYETPDVVVFNVLSMKYAEPQNEAYNRMSIDGMRWSMSKVNAIRASMTEEEDFWSYVFPILRYHSRWNDLKKEDFIYYFGADPDFYAGYYLRADVKAAENVPQGRPLTDYSFGQICWDYLDKMRLLCEEKGIDFVLIKAPSLYPYWYEEWNTQIEEYAVKNNLVYLNFLEDTMLSETGIDFSADTYDAGLHLNVYGAEKLSVWLGDFFVKQYALTDRREEAALAAQWDTISKEYYEEWERQLRELKQTESQ